MIRAADILGPTALTTVTNAEWHTTLEESMTHVIRNGIRDGNDRAMPVLPLSVRLQPTTALWRGALRVLHVVNSYEVGSA